MNFPIWTRLIVIPPSGSCRNRDSFDPSGSVQTTRYRTTRGTTTYATLHACKSSARHCHRPSNDEARRVVPYIRHTVRFTLKCGTASVSSFRGQPSATRRTVSPSPKPPHHQIQPRTYNPPSNPPSSQNFPCLIPGKETQMVRVPHHSLCLGRSFLSFTQHLQVMKS